MPFSDPMADGPVIQRAGERALEHGVGLRDVLDMVARVPRDATTTTPVVLMGYANPIEAMGIETFAAARESGGRRRRASSSTIRPRSATSSPRCSKQRGIDPIFLLAPTSTDEAHRRGRRACGSGYVYYVSLQRRHRRRNIDLAEVAASMPAHPRGHASCRSASASASATPRRRARVAQIADAVVIGSRIIQEIEAGRADEAVARVKAFLQPIRQALDACRFTA